MAERPDPSSLADPGRLKGLLRLLSARTAQGKRWRAALAVAALSDAVSVFAALAPPVQIAVDLGTVLLLLVCLRWRWAYLLALIPEALPAVAVFPFWVLVIAGLAALEPHDLEEPHADRP